MIGRLLNSLHYQLKKNLQESIYANEAFKENQWGLFERIVAKLAASPFLNLIFLLVIWFVFMVALYVSSSLLRKSIFFPWDSWEELVKWQNVLLGTQVTILGLVFPLVIGFVGLLLQSKSASQTLWDLFSKYSGFMFVGLSGLALSVVIVLGQFLQPWLTHTQEVVFSIGISIWLLFNFVLLGWFLYATFLFMGLEKRSELIIRYSINEVLIDEISSRLAQLLPQVAVENGLIVPNETEEYASQVETYHFQEEGDVSYKTSFKRKKYLSNIYFRTLNVAIWLWKFLGTLPADTKKSPRLILPLRTNLNAKKDWTYLIANNTHVYWLVKTLIRYSYIFSNKPNFEKSTIKPVINAMIGNVDDALKDNNIRLFERAIDDIQQWHADIMSVSSFEDDNGTIDNWLLLSDGSIFGRTLLDEISREYYALNHSVLQQLQNSNRYFDVMCYFSMGILSATTAPLNYKVFESLIRQHYFLWADLMNWRQNYFFAGQESSFAEKQFESAVIRYVGSWESWSHYLKFDIEESQNVKSDIALSLYYLASTARQIIIALRNNESMAAEWATDMLLYWFENNFSDKGNYSRYIWHTHILVPQLLHNDKSDELWTFILHDESFEANGAVYEAFNNAYFDVRILTSAYIASKPMGQLDDMTIKLIKALLEDKRLKPTGGFDAVNQNIGTGANIIESYIRQQWYWEYGDGTYHAWLNGVVASFNDIEREEHVSGRVYSGWGMDDTSTLHEVLMAFAIGYSNCKWKVSDEVFKLLSAKDVIALKHKQLIISDLKKWVEPEKNVLELVNRLFNINCEDVNLGYYKTSIQSFLDEINESNRQDVINAPIDRNRLRQFGVAASKTGFNKKSKSIPLTFFSSINYLTNEDNMSKFTYSLTGFQKSEIAEGIETHRAMNEDEWFDKLIADSVKYKLLTLLIEEQEKNITKYTFDDLKEAFDSIILDAKKMRELGLTPLLLTNSGIVKHKLDSTIWKIDKNKLPYDIKKQDGFAHGYICHLEETPVYRIPKHIQEGDICILTSVEFFKSVDFKEIDEGQYVYVDYILENENDLQVTLTLDYWLNAQFGSTSGYRYTFTIDDE